MRTLKSREVIKSIADEEGVSKQQVEDVINVHFEFIRHVQSQLVDPNTDYFPTVRVPNFAVFYIPDKVKKRLIAYNKKKRQEDESI